MKHAWLFVLAVLVAVSAFNNFLVSPKSNLANLIQLSSLGQPQIVKQNGREALVAQIYSTYPFNHRNLLTVNAGANHGVRPGMTVAVDGNLLLGQITEVSEDKSIVQTIFDQDFSLPVRFGEQQADALLVGGSVPKLTLIENSVGINGGEHVYSASREFPYGMAVGTVGETSNSSGDSLRESILDVPYQISDLRELAILLK